MVSAFTIVLIWLPSDLLEDKVNKVRSSTGAESVLIEENKEKELKHSDMYSMNAI